jgi:hypothetical protein
MERLSRGELAGRDELARERRPGLGRARRVVAGRRLPWRGLLLARGERASLRRADLRAPGGAWPLSRRAGELARWRVAVRPPADGRPGKARPRQVAWAVGKVDAGPRARETAGSLARETITVRAGNVPRIAGEPGAGIRRAGTRRPRVLVKGVPAKRVLTVLLSRRRAARERALRRWRVLRVAWLRVAWLCVARLLVAVPRPGGSAPGQPGFRPAIARPAVTGA